MSEFKHCTVTEEHVEVRPVYDQNPNQLTPEPCQNVEKMMYLQLTKAPKKKQFQPLIVKSKVSQDDIGEIEKTYFVVKSNNKMLENQTVFNGPAFKKSGNVSRSIQSSKVVNEFSGIASNSKHLAFRKGTEMKKTTTVKVAAVTNLIQKPNSTIHGTINSSNTATLNSKSNSSGQKVAATSAALHPLSHRLVRNSKSNALTQRNSSTTVLYPVQNGDVASNTNVNEHEPDVAGAEGLDALSVLISTNEFLQSDNGDNFHDFVLGVEEEKHKKKPVYFKSKFWDMVVPKRNNGVIPSKPEKGKKYDQVQVRDYMEKQKEVRRLKEKQEDDEKRKVFEKKKIQLQELDEKRKGLLKVPLSRRDPVPTSINEIARVGLAANQSRTKSNLKPMRVTRSIARDEIADSALRTSLLLHEFENIVHNECLSVLKFHSEKLSKSTNAVKVDKCVETTMSLLDGQGGSDSTISNLPTLTIFPLETLGMRNVVSSATAVSSFQLRNHAAVIIQSAYRGYKIRKNRREIKLEPFCYSLRERRRRSFYSTTKDKPVDQNFRNLIALTPPKNLLSLSSPDESQKVYVAPPHGFSSSPLSVTDKNSSPHPKSLPFLMPHATPLKPLSRFEEPFPKEAIRKLQQSGTTTPNRGSLDRRLSLESRANIGAYRHHETLLEPVPMDRRLSLNFDCPLPSSRPFAIVDIPVPTFSTVLREKVRILQEKTRLPTATKEPAKTSPENAQFQPEREPSYQNLSARELFQYNSDSRSGHSSFNLSDKVKDAETTITEDYVGPDADEMQRAYLLRKTAKSEFDPSTPRPRTRGHRQDSRITISNQQESQVTNSDEKLEEFSSLSATTTTIETDVELKVSPKRKHKWEKPTPEARISSSSSIPLKKYPVASIKLAYKAENERLGVLDQALQTTLALEVAKAKHEAEKAASQAQVQAQKSFKLNSNTNSNNNNSEVLVQLARCQAEQLKATAEVTKWVSELRKSSIEQDAFKKQQQPIDMAAIVMAAVEEAKKFSEERELLQAQQTQIQQLQFQRKTLLRDQVNQYPSESSNSSTPSIVANSFNTKMKATEKGTHLLESQVRRLHEEQEHTKQRLISKQNEVSVYCVQSESSISSIQADPSYTSNFEGESPSQLTKSRIGLESQPYESDFESELISITKNASVSRVLALSEISVKSESEKKEYKSPPPLDNEKTELEDEICVYDTEYESMSITKPESVPISNFLASTEIQLEMEVKEGYESPSLLAKEKIGFEDENSKVEVDSESMSLTNRKSVSIPSAIASTKTLLQFETENKEGCEFSSPLARENIELECEPIEYDTEFESMSITKPKIVSITSVLASDKTSLQLEMEEVEKKEACESLSYLSNENVELVYEPIEYDSEFESMSSTKPKSVSITSVSVSNKTSLQLEMENKKELSPLAKENIELECERIKYSSDSEFTSITKPKNASCTSVLASTETFLQLGMEEKLGCKSPSQLAKERIGLEVKPEEYNFESEQTSIYKPTDVSIFSILAPTETSPKLEMEEKKDYESDSLIPPEFQVILFRDRSIKNVADAILDRLVKEVIEEECDDSAKRVHHNSSKPVQTRIQKLMKSFVQQMDVQVSKQSWENLFVSTSILSDDMKEISLPDDDHAAVERFSKGEDKQPFKDDWVTQDSIVTTKSEKPTDDEKKFGHEGELLQIERTQAQQYQFQEKMLIRDKGNQFPIEKSNSSTPSVVASNSKAKMKTTEKNTHLLESHVRKLQEKQEQKNPRLISKSVEINDRCTQSDSPTSSIQGDQSHILDFERESPPLVKERIELEVNFYESDFESDSTSMSKQKGVSIYSVLASTETSLQLEMEEKMKWDTAALIPPEFQAILARGQSIKSLADAILIRLVREVILEEERDDSASVQPNPVKSIQTRIAEIMQGVVQHTGFEVSKQSWKNLFASTSILSDDIKETSSPYDDHIPEEKLPEGDELEWFEDDLVTLGCSAAAEDAALMEEAAKIDEEQRRIDNEIRVLEALAAREIPDKPPPPYSPPSSSGSSSLSHYSRFFAISFDEPKLKELITEQVEMVWPSWNAEGVLCHYDVDSRKNSANEDSSGISISENLSLVAARSFDELLFDTVRKIIPEVLQLESEIDKSFIDKIRPGRLALEAQRLRVPRSKEILSQKVFQKFMGVIPLELAADCVWSSNSFLNSCKRRLTKWTSRPRDLVDEVLVEELIEEDRDWTEYWPEEILITEQLQELTMRRAIREVLDNFQTVFR